MRSSNVVLSVLLYASESWTVLATDTKSLESFHMKCQRRIRWYDHIRNTEITELSPPMQLTILRCSSLFTPAHQALHCQINISLGRLPDHTWKRPPGYPRSKWLDQICSDNNLPPADLWRCAICRGHSGVTQSFQSTTQ